MSCPSFVASRPSLWCPLLFMTLFAGCEAAKVTVGDTGGPTDSGDSAETIDSQESGEGADSADTSDTAETGETGETADTALEDAFVFDLTGAWPGAGLSFVTVDAESGVLGDPVHELAVTAARQAVSLPTPAPDDIVASPDNPEFRYAVYVVGAFDDDDANGVHGETEAWVTVGGVVALYVEGSVPIELAALGIRSGWNALEGRVLTSDGAFVVYAPDGVPMNLPAPVESVTVAGTYAEAPPPDGLSVLAISYTALQGGVTGSWLYDAPMSEAAFTFTAEGRPPDDHFSDLDGNGTEEDAELLVAYVDQRPAGFNEGDTALYPGCFEGAPVLLYWLDPSPDIQAAFALGLYGLGAGWNVLVAPKGGDPVALSEADRLAITMSADCAF